MKNKSFKYPFARLGDKLYDRDKDGQLDLWETWERDMQIELDEKLRKENEKKKQNYNYSEHNSYSASDSDDSKNISSKTVENQSLLLLFLAIFVLIGGFVLVIKANGAFFEIIAINALSIVLALFLLKAGGW